MVFRGLKFIGLGCAAQDDGKMKVHIKVKRQAKMRALGAYAIDDDDDT